MVAVVAVNATADSLVEYRPKFFSQSCVLEKLHSNVKRILHILLIEAEFYAVTSGVYILIKHQKTFMIMSLKK